MGITIDSIIEQFNNSVASKRNGVEEIFARPDFKKFIQDNKTELLPDGTELLVFLRTQYYATVNQFSRARQNIDIPLFTAITEEDFKQALTSAELDPEDRPYTNFNHYDDDLALVSAYVQFDILRNPSHLQRLLAITRWILCAKDLVESYNFHSAPGIMKGLLSVKVIRTVNFGDLPIEVNAVFERLKLLSNYTLLSNLFLNSGKPIIPCHSILFRIATKIEPRIKQLTKLKIALQAQLLQAEKDESEEHDDPSYAGETPTDPARTSPSKSEIMASLAECEEELDLYNKRLKELFNRINHLKTNLSGNSVVSSTLVDRNPDNRQQSAAEKGLISVLQLFKKNLFNEDKEYLANRFYHLFSKTLEAPKLVELTDNFKKELLFKINEPIKNIEIESEANLLSFLDELKESLEKLIPTLKEKEVKEIKKIIHHFKTIQLKILAPILKKFKIDFKKAHVEFLEKSEKIYQENRAHFELCVMAVQEHIQESNPNIGLIDDALYQLSYIITRENPKKQGRYIEGVPRVTPPVYERQDGDRARLREICKLLKLLNQFNLTKIDEIIEQAKTLSSPEISQQEFLSQEASSSSQGSFSSQESSASLEIPAPQITQSSQQLSSSPESISKGSRIHALTSTTFNSLRQSTGRLYGQLHGLFKIPEEKETVVYNPLTVKIVQNPLFGQSIFEAPSPRKTPQTTQPVAENSGSSIESDSTPREDITP